MATVTCKYCGKKFNREKEPYIQIPAGTRFRYGHSQCYLDAVNSGKEKEIYEVYDPTKFVNCFWCSKAILPSDSDVTELPGLFGRYAHNTCQPSFSAMISACGAQISFTPITWAPLWSITRANRQQSISCVVQFSKCCTLNVIRFSSILPASLCFNRIPALRLCGNTPGYLPFPRCAARRYRFCR